MLPFNKKLKSFARNLRSNMTDAEQLIWSKIRRKQIEQYTILSAEKHRPLHRGLLLPKGKTHCGNRWWATL